MPQPPRSPGCPERASSGPASERLRIAVRGAVQGVGFRPFVHRLASGLGLTGWVRNDGGRVVVEVQGARDAIEGFLEALAADGPPQAGIRGIETERIAPVAESGFSIRLSMAGGEPGDALLPDLAPCVDCVRELFDPGDRRHRYPFTHCAVCGPRYSLVESLPWDRDRTAMRGFPMCEACAAEYRDPADRRFHAQTHACPECGPQLVLLDERGRPDATRGEALTQAAEILRRGRILALKAAGGFQLLVDARDESAVRRLRERKSREAKPFAVMAPDLETVARLCRADAAEAECLRSSAAPIVLLDRVAGEDGGIAPSVAPGNPRLGMMLPSTPLHHLLLADLGFPVVATSGNRSGEPLCAAEAEAVARLAGIADGFLSHDRPILRPVDDSVVQFVAGGPQILRLARGYAPLRLSVPASLPAPLAAAGAHLKNAVALAAGDRAFLGQHLGDLDSADARELRRRCLRDLARLTGIAPRRSLRDAHPDIPGISEIPGEASSGQISDRTVQHHLAHVAACMGEHGLAGPVLGIAWDGSGYGTDGTIWGGEFFRVGRGGAARIASLRTFPLPGGEAAVREPRRSALGCGFALFGERIFDRTGGNPLPSSCFLAPFDSRETALLRQTLTRGLLAPATSSMGRLFDAVASLLGLRQTSGFEGQAAMDLEFAADSRQAAPYPFAMPSAANGTRPLAIDWGPTLLALLDDLAAGVGTGEIAARFHESVVEMALAVARREALAEVVLSGGCFQNRRLSERLAERLRAEGFRPYWHRRVPPNDGGIAYGQVIAASWGLDDAPGVGHLGADSPSPSAFPAPDAANNSCDD